MSTSATTSQQQPQMCTKEDMQKLSKMIKDIEFCMLTTQDDEGNLRSRPMAVNGELDVGADGQCCLWFFTYGNSHKVLEMGKHGQQLNLAFAHPSKQSYISLSGTGHISRDRSEMQKRWNAMYNAWFPKGLEEPDIALLQVSISKAEYWDSPSSGIAHAVSFLKAKMTGEIAQPGTHKQVEMGGGAKAAEKKETMRGEEGKMH